MAKLAQARTEGSRDGPREPQAAAGETRAPPGEVGQTGVSASTATQSPPTPVFTQQDYGVMLVLVAVFIILVGSLMGRRGS